jgi:hypothetical protein
MIIKINPVKNEQHLDGTYTLYIIGVFYSYFYFLLFQTFEIFIQ